MDAHAGVGEFANALAAAAAWRAQVLAVADDDDVDDAPLAGQRHRGDRAGLGARALRIGGVLDVAAGVDRAARSADRRADEKVRVRRVSAFARRLGRGEQRVEAFVSAL